MSSFFLSKCPRPSLSLDGYSWLHTPHSSDTEKKLLSWADRAELNEIDPRDIEIALSTFKEGGL